MSETKHTPGPWIMDARGENLIGSNNVRVIIWNGGITLGYRTEETEANARLIAAAPELLKCLKMAMPLLECYYPDDAKTAQAAIAKAEGKQ